MMEIESLFQELKTLLEKGNLVLFAGAGVSQRVGYPSVVLPKSLAHG